MSSMPDAQPDPPTGTPHQAGEPEAGRTGLRPGWPEIGAAAVAFAVLYAVTIVILRAIPSGQSALGGLVEFALSAVLGLGPFAAAVAIRIRKVSAFGVRRVAGKWLLIAAGLGVGAFILSAGASLAYRLLTGDTQNVQGGYQASATAGLLPLLATLLLGAVATPIGEEFLWRGVVTTVLNRYGPWISVLVSAAAFAVAHGVNVVMPVAFIIGVCNALLYRRTGSIWPGVFLHGVNNGLSSLIVVATALAS